MKKENETKIEELANEELSNVNGGLTYDALLLRRRLSLLTSVAGYHIKDSGPTWRNQPSQIGVGITVLPVIS